MAVTSVRPMLAQEYDKYAAGIKYPCIVQPKLDGVRMLASRDTAVSRLGNILKPSSDIYNELQRLPNGCILDGELYLHSAGFETVVSKVKRQDWVGLQYHVYDLVHPIHPFSVRFTTLQHFVDGMRHILPVPTALATSSSDVAERLEEYTRQGYEGLIVRSPDGVYKEGKRSKDLLKLKKFMTAEFLVVGLQTGKNGSVIFQCETAHGERFNAVLPGSNYHRRELAHEGNVGKLLTVKFQGFTEQGKPRFPIGLALRDYE